MIWKFTLIDREGTHIIIDEPVGWDEMDIEVKRDLDTHGIVFDYSGNDFQFSGAAFKKLRSEYLKHGSEGRMDLLIEYKCEGSSAYSELYNGKLLFASYKQDTGDECIVRMGLEPTGAVMELTNRMDQKVDLLNPKAFDDTVLEEYKGLGMAVTLPSKGILIQNIARADSSASTPVLGLTDNDGIPTGVGERGMIPIACSKTVAAEIGGFVVDTQPMFNGSGILFNTYPPTWFPWTPPSNKLDVVISPLQTGAIVNYAEGMVNFGQVSDKCELDIFLNVSIQNPNAVQLNLIYIMLMRLPAGKSGDLASDYEYIWTPEIVNEGPGNGVYTDVVFSRSYFNDNFILNEGDRLYLFITVNYWKTIPQLSENAFAITFNQGSYFKLKTLSKQPATSARLFMVNEAFSRITEAITGNKVRTLSHFFGRPNSQPYPHTTHGCGSMLAITKGLFIRKMEDRNNATPMCAVSLKEMWEGINPIYNIGMGLEDDPYRPGNKVLRIEPWKYFYKDNIILRLDDVAKIKRRSVESELFSTAKFGYEKWEAEEYNGLDEYLTKREYRTSLQSVKNTFTRLSKFVASGYAWEITRRKKDESKDWRYDNDLFVTCLAQNWFIEADIGYWQWGGGVYFQTLSVVTDEPLTWVYPGSVIEILSGRDAITGVELTGFPQTNTITNGSSVSLAPIGGKGYFSMFRLQTPISFNGRAQLIIKDETAYRIEVGNIANPLNIIDPATAYNFRISPIRNAMRWFDKMLSVYRKNDPLNKLVFVDADGNKSAFGELISECRQENSPLPEDADIAKVLFTKEPTPLLRSERVEFDYPISQKQFRRILHNPYGVIEFSSAKDKGKGWLEAIKYKPEAGIASFKLIPKYE